MPLQHAREIVVLKIDRHVGQVVRQPAECFGHSLFLHRLRCRAIDFKDPRMRQERLASIRVRVEPGPEDHDLRRTVSDRPLQRGVDEPRPDHHHPDDVDDFDVLHRFVVRQAQCAYRSMIEGERRRIPEEPFGQVVRIPDGRVGLTGTDGAASRNVDGGPRNPGGWLVCGCGHL